MTDTGIFFLFVWIGALHAHVWLTSVHLRRLLRRVKALEDGTPPDTGAARRRRPWPTEWRSPWG